MARKRHSDEDIWNLLRETELKLSAGSDVSLKLDIDAEVPSGMDRAKVRTILENANTLGFIDKDIRC